MIRSLLLAVFVITISAPTTTTARVWVVAQAHPAANDSGPGTAENPLSSVTPAAEQAGPGDIVRIHAGIYRERIAPASGGAPDQPIIYEAAEGDTVVFRGSDELAGPWTRENDGLEAHSIAGLKYESHWHPYRAGLRQLKDLTCGMLFVDNERLVQARSRVEAVALPGSWWYDVEGDRVLVHFAPGPRPKLIEAAARERVFAPHQRGLGHITVRGFVIEHAANQFPADFWVKHEGGYPQAGAIGTRSGHDWVIERNVIRQNANLGLDVGVEGGRDLEGNQPQPTDYGRHLVRNNIFEANGAGGIAGFRATGVVITGNTVRATNWQGHTAPETAGIKLHLAYGGRIEGNRVHDNDCYGIWLDNVYTDARVERNLVHGNAGAGIFIELGGGPGVVAWNVVAENRGDGIYLHDASDVLVAHNLLALNQLMGFHARTISNRTWSDRAKDFAPVRVGTHRVRLLNNVFIDNSGGALSRPFPSEHTSEIRSDHNLYLSGTQSHSQKDPTRLWHLNLDGGEAAVPFKTRKERLAIVDSHAGETGFLTLNNWRHTTGHDLKSQALAARDYGIANGAAQPGAFLFRALGGWLRFADTSAINGHSSVPLTEIGRRDYFGVEARKVGSLCPGPFQDLPAGAVTLPIWPR